MLPLAPRKEKVSPLTAARVSVDSEWLQPNSLARDSALGSGTIKVRGQRLGHYFLSRFPFFSSIGAEPHIRLAVDLHSECNEFLVLWLLPLG